jgi:hypothetical protein
VAECELNAGKNFDGKVAAISPSKKITTLILSLPLPQLREILLKCSFF